MIRRESCNIHINGMYVLYISQGMREIGLDGIKSMSLHPSTDASSARPSNVSWVPICGRYEFVRLRARLIHLDGDTMELVINLLGIGLFVGVDQDNDPCVFFPSLRGRLSSFESPFQCDQAQAVSSSLCQVLS